jgi:hypothetical protein
MSYYTQKNMCDVYRNIGITSNKKYTNPFVENTQKISLFNPNNHRINSYEYLNNNLYPCDKSYNNIVNSYKHFVTGIIEKKKEQISELPDATKYTDKELDIEIDKLKTDLKKSK